MRSDLHIHSNHSDGKFSVSKIVDYAVSKGIGAIALTDHDTVDGVEECREIALDKGLKFATGIELSTFSNIEIHILGYNFDTESETFKTELQKVKEYRKNRNILIGERLVSLGVNLDFDFSKKGVGRKNIADKMVSTGICGTVQECFDKYLGKNGKAYVTAKRLTPLEGVKLIAESGGIPVIAHPKQYLLDRRLEPLILGLKGVGLKGLEVNYPNHTDIDTDKLKAMARKHHLIETGGSDLHDYDKNFVFDLDPRTAKALKFV